MLNMLDAIHDKFYNIENGWQKLTDTKTDSILSFRSRKFWSIR